MNIVVTINSAYVMPLKALLYSLCQHNSDCDLFMLETEKLTPDEYEEIRKIVGGRLTVIPVSVGMEHGGRFPQAALARILTPYVMPDQIKRALYLDADMLVRGSIEELYNVDLHGKGIAGVADFYFDDINDFHMKALHIERPAHYISSGVLLMDLERLREIASCSEVRDALQKFHRISPYIDQDFINDFYRQEIVVMGIEYNHSPFWKPSGRFPVIVHYFGGGTGGKPWHREYSMRYFIEYRRVWNKVNPEHKLSMKTYLGNVAKKLKNALLRK